MLQNAHAIWAPADKEAGIPAAYVDIAGQLSHRTRPLPYCLRIVLENVLRHSGARPSQAAEQIVSWSADSPSLSVPMRVSRMIFPDSSGLPALMDLAAARDALARKALPPQVVEPVVPLDLIIDHSLIVDWFGTREAASLNAAREFERNAERYSFFKWAQQAFAKLRVAPPGMGIVHQIHLERLAKVVSRHQQDDGRVVIAPEFVLGCDSHTPMVNGLGLLAWGVGGIDAEAVLLGGPYVSRIPRVVGVRLRSALPAGATTTDLVLTVTERLRQVGVVNDFVEFFGPGVGTLSVPDRATLANMAPEYGATIGYFPIDERTIEYLRQSGRDEADVSLVANYARATGLFVEDATAEPEFSAVVEIDLSSIVPSVAGPKRPQDRQPLTTVGGNFRKALTAPVAERGFGLSDKELSAVAAVKIGDTTRTIGHGSLVIAAITSCTNTSNPSVMIAAGLLARNAVAKGLSVAPGIKTSLAPGSRLVHDYLVRAGLTEPLEALGFYLVGFGCTTCSGKSGPIDPQVASAIENKKLVAAAVLSGNRNFEGRVHHSTRANYLASPPLVVAFAIAGRIDIDFETEPLGTDKDQKPVFLRDIWPDADEVAAFVRQSQAPDQFRKSYATLFDGTSRWKDLPAPAGPLFRWNEASEYLKRPPFFELPHGSLPDAIENSRALCVFGDSLTTDHITPSGEIAPDSVAGRFLLERGVKARDFNAVTQRRGNHEFMARVTFANPRLQNLLAGGLEGGWTRLAPGDQPVSIYDAAKHYEAVGTPVIVFAGRDYGMGSSRDWAAKGPRLLGVRVVIAVSFERIHRANLIGMGIVPLIFRAGDTFQSLALSGFERYSLHGLSSAVQGGGTVHVVAADASERSQTFEVSVDLANDHERDLLLTGGMFPRVLATMVAKAKALKTVHGAAS